MDLPRQRIKAAIQPPLASLDFDSALPLQVSLDRCPWRVAVASMLLCRTRRAQAEPVLKELLTRWPTVADLARAEGLEEVVRPCGLHVMRSRILQRFSVGLLADWWTDMRELPGMGGLYVVDAVSLFCFDCVDLRSSDGVLKTYRNKLCSNS